MTELMNKNQVVGLLALCSIALISGCSEPGPAPYPIERLDPPGPVTLEISERASGARAAPTPQGFFDAHPVWLGRGFVEHEFQPSAEPSVVLTHGLWELLGASPAMIGSKISLDDEARTVVGVTAKDPQLDAYTDLLVPKLGAENTEPSH